MRMPSNGKATLGRAVHASTAVYDQATLDGAGITALPVELAAPHLASGALVRVLPRWRSPSLPLHLVTTTRNKRTARVQVFMDWAHALIVQRLGPHIERT